MPDTIRYLEAEPRMKLNADFSHWCCVHESNLEDQNENMEIAIERSYHIHARVGHGEGPQVTDPRAPEWQGWVDLHLGWWKKIIQHRVAEGLEHFTICPEFGAPNYLLCLPFTNQPVTDQFAMNVYMKDRIKELIAEL
ncbi:MAG: hypothetical protein HRU15_07165 [Planctomycetes bacterium]|nr:hypothetical protein [Planctomycetota bacterium]